MRYSHEIASPCRYGSERISTRWHPSVQPFVSQHWSHHVVVSLNASIGGFFSPPLGARRAGLVAARRLATNGACHKQCKAAAMPAPAPARTPYIAAARSLGYQLQPHAGVGGREGSRRTCPRIALMWRAANKEDSREAAAAKITIQASSRARLSPAPTSQRR